MSREPGRQHRESAEPAGGSGPGPAGFVNVHSQLSNGWSRPLAGNVERRDDGTTTRR